MMFTVEVKLKGQLILSRSCNRIAGETHGLCLYISDDGRFIEHHYDHGAAILAAQLLSGVTNTLGAAHVSRIRKWEKKNGMRIQDKLARLQARTKTKTRTTR